LNKVKSLRAGSSLKGMDGRRLNSERRPPATRYEINDLKDRCREKLLDFFIALRREIEDEDFLTQCRPLDGKDRKRNNPPEGHTSRSTNLPPANFYLHEADLWIERKMQERKMKYEIKICFGSVR